MPNEKQWIYAIYNEDISYNGLREVREIIDQAIKAEERGEWKDLRMYVRGEYDVAIKGRRLETDAEQATRENRSRENEKRERELFKILKAKYND